MTRQEYYDAARAREEAVEAALRSSVENVLTPAMESTLREWNFIQGDEDIFDAIRRALTKKSEWSKETGSKVSGTGWQQLSKSDVFGDTPEAKRLAKETKAYAKGVRNNFGHDDVQVHEYLVKEALDAGQPVPENVIADYPRLRAPETKPVFAPELTPELKTQIDAYIDGEDFRKQFGAPTVPYQIKKYQEASQALLDADITGAKV
ncbi:MAG: hypothetical protein ACYSW8_31550, partial [Planctomycetota bacterium]